MKEPSRSPRSKRRRFLSAPILFSGLGSGLAAGLAVGAMVTPPVVGLVVGLLLGATVGVVAGYVMAKDDERRDRRTKELDDIIGVTSGSLGARGSIPPSEEDAARRSELAAWANEWLTPPPPASST